MSDFSLIPVKSVLGNQDRVLNDVLDDFGSMANYSTLAAALTAQNFTTISRTNLVVSGNITVGSGKTIMLMPGATLAPDNVTTITVQGTIYYYGTSYNSGAGSIVTSGGGRIVRLDAIDGSNVGFQSAVASSVSRTLHNKLADWLTNADFNLASPNTVQNILLARSGEFDYQLVICSGYYASGDGGGGIFMWQSSSSATHDGGTIIKPTAVVGNGRWFRIGMDSSTRLRWFGPAADDTTDDSAVFNTAIAATPPNGRLIIDVGNYYLNSGLTPRQSGIAIELNGNVRVNPSISTDVFSLRMQPLGTLDVSLMDNTVAIDMEPSFVGNANTNCCKLTLSASAPSYIKPGMLAKVVSQDYLPGVAANRPTGEFITIGAVSGTDVWTRARLVETFNVANSVKLVVYDPSQVVSVYGTGKIYSDWDAVTAINTTVSTIFLHISGAITPEVRNIRFENGAGIGLQLSGCWATKTYSLTFARFRDAITSLSIPGYGILENGCAESQILLTNAYSVRHAYTNGMLTTSFAAIGWGRSYNTNVIGGIAIGCSSAAWDTSDGAKGISFTNLQAINPYVGESSGYAGFQIRGTQNIVSNCIAQGYKIGYTVVRTYTGLPTCDNTFSNCEYYGDGIAYQLQGYDASNKSTVRINGGTLNGKWDTAFALRHAILYADSVKMICSGAGLLYTNEIKVCYIDESYSGEFYLNDLRINLSGHTATTVWLADLRQQTGTPKFKLTGTLILGAANWTGVIKSSGTIATPVDGYFDLDTDKICTDTDGILTLGSASTFGKRMRIDGGKGGYWLNQQLLNISASQALDVYNLIDHIITRRYNSTNVASKITSMSVGMFDGQELQVICDASSTQSLVIEHNTTNLIDCGGSDVTVAAGVMKRFIWRSSQAKWRIVS